MQHYTAITTALDFGSIPQEKYAIFSKILRIGWFHIVFGELHGKATPTREQGAASVAMNVLPSQIVSISICKLFPSAFTSVARNTFLHFAFHDDQINMKTAVVARCVTPSQG